MQEMLKNYSELKDEIHHLGSQKSDNDFVKLVTLKNEDDELKETLILLHTNYKNEIQELKASQIKINSKLIDQNILLIHKLEKLIEINQEKDAETQRTFKIHSIERVLAIILFIIFCFWTMATINNDAFHGSIGALDKVFCNLLGTCQK